VDYLVHTGAEMYELSRFGSISIGVVAAFLGLLAASGIGLPIAFGTAAVIVGGIALLGTITTFLGSGDAIEAARDDIVCAIMQGGDLAAAVETALESGLDWDLWYSFVPYESALAILYEGGHDGEFLPAELRDDCLCEEDSQFAFRWDEDIEGWQPGGQMNQVWSETYEGLEGIGNATGWMQGGNQTVPLIDARFSTGTPIYVRRIKYRVRFDLNGQDPISLYSRIEIQDKFFEWHTTEHIGSIAEGWDQWIEVSFTFDSTHELRPTNTCLLNSGWRSVAETGQRIIIDNLRFYPDLG